MLVDRPWGFKARSANQLLINTIDATGGLDGSDPGCLVPVADEDWHDLADAYLKACAEEGVDPVVSVSPPDADEPSCAHEWVHTGTAYGGDDERYMGEGRVYCSKCGADGDG